MLSEAHQLQNKLKARGIILLGDFNARHVTWGDTINNLYGEKLAEELDAGLFSICSPQSPTFLSANGSSVIDLLVVSNDLLDKIETCCTDEEVELFSGAPQRGHVPILTKLQCETFRVQVEATRKPCIEKMKWEEWSNQIENKIIVDEEQWNSINDPAKLWEYLDKTLLESTNNHCETKISTKHSKPYWTPNLTILSKRLREQKKKYKQRNTDSNLQKWLEVKQEFDSERKTACQQFILDKTKTLNSVQALHFWKKFNNIFKKKSDKRIEPLSNGDGGLTTDSAEVEDTLFATFFEAKHLTDGNFDDEFFITVNNMYDEVHSTEHNINEINHEQFYQELNNEITLSEIKKVIKNLNCSGKSFDNHNLHPSMLQHVKQKTLKLIHKLFNMCLLQNNWVWDTAEVIFLKKEGKDTYSKPGSYCPISITSYIGKLLERIIANRLSKLLQSLLQHDSDQEGFTPNRNTIRYLNRLHLGIKADLERKLKVISLFIDFEKAFDSV